VGGKKGRKKRGGEGSNLLPLLFSFTDARRIRTSKIVANWREGKREGKEWP